MRLKGKTALITGGTSGIGLETAALFIQEGARVAVTGRDVSRINDIKATLGEEALVLAADVRSLDDMKRVAHDVKKNWGGLDIFFANAGIAFGTPLATTNEARYDEMMDTNLKGVFFSMQALAPVLRESASVILTTSFIIHQGRPGLSLLSASKAGLRSLARSWSREFLERKIRVNAISPGAIDTPLHARAAGSEAQAKANKEALAQRVPVGYIGQPRDIASAALYLASDESRYVVGAEIVVDGGISQL